VDKGVKDMPESLKDILPPPPHEVAKMIMGDAKGVVEGLKDGAKGVLDDGKNLVHELAPHNVLPDLRPNKDMLPPLPPKPPRFGE